MKKQCVVCGDIFDESELEEPFGLSGLSPGCPSCGSDDFLDVEEE